MKLDALSFVAALNFFGKLNAERAHDWVHAGCNDCYLAAEFSGGGGNFAADEASSQNNYVGVGF